MQQANFDRLATRASSGASGAFVGAMLALFGKNAQVVSGMDFVAELTDLESQIKKSDLAVTGEGSFDEQTLQGKAVAQIIDMCLKNSTQVLVVCGINQVSDEAMEKRYTSDELQKISVLDLVSNYGKLAALNQTNDCVARIFKEDKLDDLLYEKHQKKV